MLKAPRLLTDSEVEEALPTLSVSSLSDWATDGAAETVFERDQVTTIAGLSAAGPLLDGPVLGDSVSNDCCTLLSPEAVFDDIALVVRLG